MITEKMNELQTAAAEIAAIEGSLAWLEKNRLHVAEILATADYWTPDGYLITELPALLHWSKIAVFSMRVLMPDAKNEREIFETYLRNCEKAIANYRARICQLQNL